mgnify:CR=1 FL=1
MTGLNNFINLFGQVTLSTVVELVLAGVFLYLIYKKVRDFLIERYELKKPATSESMKHSTLCINTLSTAPRALRYSKRWKTRYRLSAKQWSATKPDWTQ